MKTIEETVNGLSEEKLKAIAEDYYRNLNGKVRDQIVHLDRFVRFNGKEGTSPLEIGYEFTKEKLSNVELWDEKLDEYYSQALKGELNVKELRK